MAINEETFRPPHEERAMIPETTREGEKPKMRRVWVSTSKVMEDHGLSVVQNLARQGYVKVEDETVTPDGRGFYMEIPQERWEKEIRAPAKKRSRAQQGLKPAERVGEKDRIEDVDLAKETFTGKEVMDAAMARQAAIEQANENNG